jgi:hypothetical protein
MARIVMVKVLDGKQDTMQETIVHYPVGIPSDVLFYNRNGITYAQWWNTAIPPVLVAVPTFQILSIE